MKKLKCDLVIMNIGNRRQQSEISHNDKDRNKPHQVTTCTRVRKLSFHTTLTLGYMK